MFESYQKEITKLKETTNRIRNERELTRILFQNRTKSIVILLKSFDYHTPMKQHVERLVSSVDKQKCLFFYVSNQFEQQPIDGFKKVAENIFVTNQLDLLNQLNLNKSFHFFTKPLGNTLELKEKIDQSKEIVLYRFQNENTTIHTISKPSKQKAL